MSRISLNDKTVNQIYQLKMSKLIIVFVFIAIVVILGLVLHLNEHPLKSNIISYISLQKTRNPDIGLGSKTEYNSIYEEEEAATSFLDDISFLEENIHALDQDDPRFIKYVRSRYIVRPNINQQYNLVNKKGPYATAHSRFVRKFLKDKRDGIFIEAGANNGEVESHTLELEKELGWTGLLVECNPTVVPYLRSKHRKAWVAGVCLSRDQHFSVFNYANPLSYTYSGRIGEAIDLSVYGINSSWTNFDVESVPFYSIIAAVGYTEIDFLLLDVEGLEYYILTSFPFDKITIKLMLLEIAFIPEDKLLKLTPFLETKGFRLVEKFKYDWAYAHKSLVI